MSVAEVRADLAEFIGLVRQHNPDLKILLTVSPVPLVATYEDRTCCKPRPIASPPCGRPWTRSVGTTRRSITSLLRDHHQLHNGGAYFEADLRSVAESGVAHVMRVFERHYLRTVDRPAARQDAALRAEFARASKILCDEEALDMGR